MSSALSFHKALFLKVNHKTAFLYKIFEYKSFIKISIGFHKHYITSWPKGTS